MKRERLASVRLQVWLLVAFALLPALGLMFYTAVEQRRGAVKNAQEQALRVAQLVSNDQERLIDGTRHLLVALAHVPDVRDHSPADCSRFMSSLLKDKPLYINFGVANRTGDIVCSGVPMDEPVNVLDRLYFVAAVVTRGFAVGEFQIGRITGRATLVFGYPVLDGDDKTKAVLFAAMDLSWLNHLVSAADLPVGASLMVIDRNGTILARYPQPESWVGISAKSDPLFQAMVAQGQGTAEFNGLDGVPQIYAFTGLRGLPEAGYVSIGIPQALAYAPARQALVRNLLGLGFVGALALAAAWIGGEVSIVRPVQALVGAAKRLSAGDLSARSGLAHGTGELPRLAAAFDDMAAALEKQQMQQRLEEDLRRHNEALEEENRRIREVNQLKSDFVSLVSHELRTPLTAISGYLDLLLEEHDEQTEKSQELLNIVRRNTDRLVKLLDDLLDVSRIESGRIELDLISVDIIPLITEVASLLQPQIEAKGQQLTLTQTAALPPVWGDAEHIRRILINLLSNAHKYTSAGGHIWISAAEIDGWVRIDVRDDGIGLSTEEQTQVFDKFFRAQRPGTQEVGGTGLGLAITRLLVELHGGKISVASTPGQGATFSFTLPAAHMPRRTPLAE